MQLTTYDGLVIAIGSLVFGLILMLKASDILVASSMGMPETFVALTVNAIGTSLPEMTTSFLAAMRGKNDMVIGNILGSNVFNVLAIMGVTASLSPVRSSGTVDLFDLVVFIGSALALLTIVWLKGVPRWVGGIMLFAYSAYVATQFYAIS